MISDPSGTPEPQDVPAEKLQALRTLLNAGRLEDVVKLGGILLHSHATSGALHTVVAIAYARLGQTDRALDLLRSAIRVEPGFRNAHINLGAILQSLGRTEDAIHAYRVLLQIEPTNVAAHGALGDLFRSCAQTLDAIRHYRSSLDQDPRQPGIHNNLGTCLQQIGDLDAAIASYTAALKLQPLDTIARNNKAICLNLQNRSNAAIACYRMTLCIAPGSAETLNNLGICLKDLERHGAAVDCLTRALFCNPRLVDAHINICEIHEISNRTEALREALQTAGAQGFFDHPDIQYYRALIHLRDKDYAQASGLIRRIPEGSIAKYRLNSFYSVKGKILDKAEAFDDAFDAFVRMNERLQTSDAYTRIDTESYLADLRSLNDQLGGLGGIPRDHAFSATPDAPAFLVGFPRSGTTLLETILFSHSRVVILDEKPAVDRSRASLGPVRDLRALGALTDNDVAPLRAAYFREVRKHVPDRGVDTVLIDKLPLNSLEAPFIHRLFPNAKFILAVRHPLDCILSCFMQNFGLNPAMANMLDLARIVDFYCLTMEIWTRSERLFDLQVHMLRYEDLVVDMPGEIARLLTFLGLEWEETVHNYQSTALQRGVINTPSYSQVIQPLYRDASYRWKHYARHLEPFIEQVQPWISHFGYEDT